MRISDWSSDVCSSDLLLPLRADALAVGFERGKLVLEDHLAVVKQASDQRRLAVIDRAAGDEAQQRLLLMLREISVDILGNEGRSEEHTSELQSLMRISYAVFCLKNNNITLRETTK